MILFLHYHANNCVLSLTRPAAQFLELRASWERCRREIEGSDEEDDEAWSDDGSYTDTEEDEDDPLLLQGAEK